MHRQQNTSHPGGILGFGSALPEHNAVNLPSFHINSHASALTSPLPATPKSPPKHRRRPLPQTEPSKATTKRRRPSDVSDEDEATHPSDIADMKRVRPLPSLVSSPSTSSKPFSNSMSAYEQEKLHMSLREPSVQRGLEALSKEGLLKLMNRLMENDPPIVNKIREFMPLLSLDEAKSEIQKLERLVLDSIPYGSVREEYTWDRVYGSLEVYVRECGSFLSILLPLHYGSPSCTYNVLGRPLNAELSHPSTTFELLYATTQSVQRLETALPTSAVALIPAQGDILSASFIPQLFYIWSLFVNRVAVAMHSGQILNASMVRQWIDKIDALYYGSVSRAPLTHSGLESLRNLIVRDLGDSLRLVPDGCMSPEHNDTTLMNNLSLV